MATDYERDDEMFDQLAEAVFAGDLAKAEEVLNFMQGAGISSEQIRRAKHAHRAGRAGQHANLEAEILGNSGRHRVEHGAGVHAP